MDKGIFKGSLQAKILINVITLITACIVSILAISIYMDVKKEYENVKNLSLQTAKTISYMQTVKGAFYKAYPPKDLQPQIETIRYQVDAAFITVINKEGRLYAHPDPQKIWSFIDTKDSYKALVFGGFYNTQTEETVGPAIVGKAPIINDSTGQILGVVTVGYLLKNMYKGIITRVLTMMGFAFIVIIIGVLSSLLLARSIRKDTLGLEPRQIASLYRDRVAILSSINEGIISMDHKGRITVINKAARKILELSGNYVNQPIQKVMPELNIAQTLENQEKIIDSELNIRNKNIILNLIPIYEGTKLTGAVASFRDKTEIQKMVNALSEVRKYSEDLRAQTHEFANKLYVLSGLLQLGYYEDAVKMIQEEIETNETNNRLVFSQIEDPKVQAIILGKIGKASEKKIEFEIDENTSLGVLPEHIETVQLTVIIGNLIDNAFEEVMKKKEKKVTFSALDLGEDIIFEVTDTGDGVPEEYLDSIFKPGFSTKTGKEARGYGLANVDRMVKQLNGMIQISNEQPGTTFTVYIPKELERGVL